MSGGRSLKKGGIYQRYNGSESYVRIVSLDLDLQTALCQEIFKENVRGTLEKKLTIKFEDIGNPSDVPESEAALREWGALGQKITQVTERVTKAEFTDLLRKGQLLITDDAVVYRTPDGQLTTYTLRESKTYGYGTVLKHGAENWLRDNADVIAYPDVNDVELKTAVAGWARSDKSKYGAEQFFTALFGRDYKTELANYGEVAPAGEISSAVAAYLAKALEGTDREGRNFKGEGKSQYGAYLVQGQYDPAKYMEYHVSVRSTAYIPALYKNQSDFTAALMEAFALKSRDHFANTVTTAKDRAHKVWLNYRDQLKVEAGEVLAMLDTVPVTASQMSYVYRSYTQNHLDYEANNYDQLFAHAVRLGLVEESSITEDCFNDSIGINETVSRINAAFSEANKDRQALIDSFKLRAGLVNQEEIDAAKAARAAREEEAKVETEAALQDALTVKRNSQALTGGKGANRFNYGPDEAICLQDSDGKDGALYRAKDTLKSVYGAKYHNGKISGQ